MVFGGLGALISYYSGKLIESIGIKAAMIIMLMSALAHSVFMLSWTPDVNFWWLIFAMMSAFAFTNSMATGQVRAMFGIFYPNNANAYSAAITFETIGLIVGSVISFNFCTRVKTFVYSFIILLSLVCFLIFGVRRKKEALNHANQTTN